MSWIPLLSTILILWLATGLRFHHLKTQSFWNDEGNSARLSERPVAAIIEGTASDIHPPLYYICFVGGETGLGDSRIWAAGAVGLGRGAAVAATIALGGYFRRRDRPAHDRHAQRRIAGGLSPP